MSRTNQKEASQMKSHYTVQDLTKMALLTALISVSAYINIPLPFSPVTITAQTLVVNMIALLLTPRQAGFCILVYSLLGLVGLPVFSGGVGGPGKLFGPSGGYIFSWLPAVMLMSALKGRNYHFIRYCAVTIFVGMPVIYSIGTVYMKYGRPVCSCHSFHSPGSLQMYCRCFNCPARAGFAGTVRGNLPRKINSFFPSSKLPLSGRPRSLKAVFLRFCPSLVIFNIFLSPLPRSHKKW